MPRSRVPVLVLALALLLAGCGAERDPLATTPPGPSEPGTVRVGSGDFAESRLLAEIYAQGLQLRGVTVERTFGTGRREDYLPALRAGDIDLVPEYTGNLLRALRPEATATAPEEVYAQARAALPPNLVLLTPAPAQNSDAVVVTRALAEQNALSSIADLAPLCPTLQFGGSPEFAQRPYGLAALARTYGCTVGGYRTLDAGGPLTVAALRDGQVQAANLFTTDAVVGENDFVVLTDPRDAFAAQNVVPLLAAVKLDDPRVPEVLDTISAQLDTAVLTDLNRQLDAPDRPDPAEVARSWLASAGVG